MAHLLTRLLEKPRSELHSDPRVEAYLVKATVSVQPYETLRDLTSKDIAISISSARQVGTNEAEDLADQLVRTVADQLARLSPERVSYYITAFSKSQITDQARDRAFWVAAAKAIAGSTDDFSPQVLVSLLDAFRKSGLRSSAIFQVMLPKISNVMDDLSPGLIPPIVATLCRAPLKGQDRDRVILALLAQWLRFLKNEQQRNTGAIQVVDILSLTVSLGTLGEGINTAAFAKDVIAYMEGHLHEIQPQDLISFLYAIQRLVAPGTNTAFFVRCLAKVKALWPVLQDRAELSLQRLIQLSDVYTVIRGEVVRRDPNIPEELKELQSLLLQELSDAIQYARPEDLAELLEMWRGIQTFWRDNAPFRDAIVKRLEELLVETVSFEELLPILNALADLGGLYLSLPPRAKRILTKALQSRGPEDLSRAKAVLAGKVWEAICAEEPDSEAVGREAAETPEGDQFQQLLDNYRPPRSVEDLAEFLRAGSSQARGPVQALAALEAAAPFVQLLAADVTHEVYSSLASLCNVIENGLSDLPPARIAAALQACSVAGLPHLGLFTAALGHLDLGLGTLQLVEVLESFAALRLSIPELQEWLRQLSTEDFERRLPAVGLVRLLAASARLDFVEQKEVDRLLQRIVSVANLPGRQPPLEVVATLCSGLYFADWNPCSEDLWQIASWLHQAGDAPEGSPQLSALRQFSLSLLVTKKGRAVIADLPEEMRRALAGPALVQPGPRFPAISDTTLKFRHQVTELLRQRKQRYDLDLSVGPGVAVDLALPNAELPLWQLHGPEVFKRPFPAAPDGTGLRLVASERRKTALIEALLDPGNVEEVLASLRLWSQRDLDPNLTFGLQRPAVLRTQKLCQMNWLQWEKGLCRSWLP